MFSKELENLIQATLEDGKLEDYEKAALVKRAQAEGVDLAELEIYINSILQRREREANQKKEEKERTLNKQKKEAFGRVCPNCGAQVLPMAIKCECGYEFTGQKAVSSVQLLFDKLNNITLTPSDEKAIDKENTADDMEGVRNKIILEKKINIISLFPIPNTKEDIIDFLSLSISEANKTLGFLEKKLNCAILTFFVGPITGGLAFLLSVMVRSKDMFFILLLFVGVAWVIAFQKLANKPFAAEKLKKTWRAKYEQVLIKGRSMRGDSDFIQQLDYYEKLLKK